MKKIVFAFLRTFMFVALMPMLSLSLVSCEPDEDADDVPSVVDPDGEESADDTDGSDSDTKESEDVTSAIAVDLGLPSGLLWASCNVGATSPEDYGGYYAWGEVEEKSNYSWSTYKWCNGSADTQTKYCTSSSYGTVDGKTTLDLEDDVAHVQWGGNWRMPTEAELEELCKECDWKCTSVNGVKGQLVTGSNGNSIFLPIAGDRYHGSVYDRGRIGSYRSASLLSHLSSHAYILTFMDDDDDGHCTNGSRFNGLTVRPVTEK